MLKKKGKITKQNSKKMKRKKVLKNEK